MSQRQLFIMVAAPVLALLAGCGSSDNKNSPSSNESTISMEKALASDAGATSACKTLFGDGKQLREWRFQTNTPGKLVATRDTHSLKCGVRSSDDSPVSAAVVIYNDDATYTEEQQGAEQNEAPGEWAAAQNAEQHTGMVVRSIVSSKQSEAQQTLTDLVRRVKN